MVRVREGWVMLVGVESVGGKAKAERVVSPRVRVRPSWWMAPRMDHGTMPGNFVVERGLVMLLDVEQDVMEGVVTVVGGADSGMGGESGGCTGCRWVCCRAGRGCRGSFGEGEGWRHRRELV